MAAVDATAADADPAAAAVTAVRPWPAHARQRGTPCTRGREAHGHARRRAQGDGINSVTAGAVVRTAVDGGGCRAPPPPPRRRLSSPVTVAATAAAATAAAAGTTAAAAVVVN